MTERREYQQSYYEKNREVIREQQRIYGEKPDAKAKKLAAHLYKWYRLRPDEFYKIRDFQREHELFRLLLNRPGAPRREAVEHRHRDGMVRGVMAPMLNKAYGIIEKLYPNNTGDILRALAEFHDNPPATVVLGAPRYGIIGRVMSKKVMKYGPIGDITKNVRLHEK